MVYLLVISLVIYRGIFMPYFATIYIHPMQGNIPHAFLGLTHKHPDELDLQDEALKQEQLKNAHWKDFNKSKILCKVA